MVGARRGQGMSGVLVRLIIIACVSVVVGSGAGAALRRVFSSAAARCAASCSALCMGLRCGVSLLGVRCHDTAPTRFHPLRRLSLGPPPITQRRCRRGGCLPGHLAHPIAIHCPVRAAALHIPPYTHTPSYPRAHRLWVHPRLAPKVVLQLSLTFIILLESAVGPFVASLRSACLPALH